MDDITVYNAGVRGQDGEYSQFVESRDRAEVDEYIEIMKLTLDKKFTIITHQLDYRCIGVIPRIVRHGVLGD